MALRRTARAVTTTAVAGTLALTFTGTASAAAATNLNWMGCPSSYTNNYGDGQFQQYRTSTYIAGNGLKHGTYDIYFVNWSGNRYQNSTDYFC
ncbi:MULTISPECIES: hypothetical protein [Kitasatospora]|uniref:Uncharacterized protein n=1 Tax=Kitasatospora setae (strain ATCC 33774 / DSM 43861 / JCM 3304 / KCC A-0304 / NBRC 14216 / KM-6054) TaxID=452652 RepID=E4N5X6_KITSK|nr:MULTISPECIES: hypothetical protein [Kitasatospora]BAJ26607.1 hypothetical protein KSE_07670 [Kitasatospora setae KM-6054]